LRPLNLQKLSKQPVSQVSQALVGLTPGLQLFSPADSQAMTFYFTNKGTGSIGASNDPLVLIDGVAGI